MEFVSHVPMEPTLIKRVNSVFNVLKEVIIIKLKMHVFKSKYPLMELLKFFALMENN